MKIAALISGLFVAITGLSLLSLQYARWRRSDEPASAQHRSAERSGSPGATSGETQPKDSDSEGVALTKPCASERYDQALEERFRTIWNSFLTAVGRGDQDATARLSEELLAGAGPWSDGGMDELVRGLEHESVAVRRVCIELVARRIKRDRIGVLVGAFDREASRELKVLYLTAFHPLATDPEIAKRIQAAARSGDGEMRIQALTSLALSGETESTAELLSELIASTSEISLRIECIALLGRVARRGSKGGGNSLVRVFRESARESERQVAFEQIRAAGVLSLLTDQEIRELEGRR